MKYLDQYKIFESHWKDELIGKLGYKRSDNIREVLLYLMDNGYNISIHNVVCDENFGEPGKKSDFLQRDRNLYEFYKVYITNESYDPRNISLIIENREEELLAINRFVDMGFNMRIGQNWWYLYMDEDIIDKKLFITDISKSMQKNHPYSIQVVKDKLDKNLSKICEIKLSDKGDSIYVIPLEGDFVNYSIDQILVFTGKIIGVLFKASIIDDIILVEKL